VDAHVVARTLVNRTLVNRTLATLIIASLVGTTAARATSAQSSGPPATAVLRIRAADEKGASVDGESVELRNARGTLLLTVTTRMDGRAAVAIPGDTTPLRYTARREGFAASSGVVRVPRRDTVTLELRLKRSSSAPDAGRGSATRVRPLAPNYDLAAAEIARGGLYILDAYDALRDLRPSMLGDESRQCPAVQNLWVNGEQQVPAPGEQLVPAHVMLAGDGDEKSARPAGRGDVLAFRATAKDPLGRIRAVHVETMHYVSCWDRSDKGAHGENALFITLKPGVRFEMKRGSFVADSAAARRAHAIP